MRDVREISLKQRAPEGCAREAHGGSLVVHHLPLSHPQTHNASLSFSAQTRRHAAHNYHGGRPHRDAGCRGRRSDRGEPQGHPRGESFGGLAHSLTLSTGTYGPAPLRSLAPPPSRAVPSSRPRGRGQWGSWDGLRRARRRYQRRSHEIKPAPIACSLPHKVVLPSASTGFERRIERRINRAMGMRRTARTHDGYAHEMVHPARRVRWRSRVPWREG